MDIGNLNGQTNQEQGNQDGGGYEGYGYDGSEVLAAIGKGSGCYTCGGDHFQRECPYKGKGKGKTGWKGETNFGKSDWSKGLGKGMVNDWLSKGAVDKGKGK